MNYFWLLYNKCFIKLEIKLKAEDITARMQKMQSNRTCYILRVGFVP